MGRHSLSALCAARPVVQTSRPWFGWFVVSLIRYRYRYRYRERRVPDR
jgi:hypothetical protein